MLLYVMYVPSYGLVRLERPIGMLTVTIYGRMKLHLNTLLCKRMQSLGTVLSD